MGYQKKMKSLMFFHMVPASSAHTKNPIPAAMKTEKLNDGEEEGGAGMVPKTVG